MSKIIILIGAAASGKPTWAQNYIKENDKTIIVSRDNIRMSLFGYTPKNLSKYYESPDLNSNEKIVSEFHTNQIWYAIQKGFDVIADNTHLRKSYINAYKMFGVELQLISFHVPEEEAFIRDLWREKYVGEDVIKKQMIQARSIFDSKMFKEIDEYNEYLKVLTVSAKKKPNDINKKNVITIDCDHCPCYDFNCSFIA